MKMYINLWCVILRPKKNGIFSILALHQLKIQTGSLSCVYCTLTLVSLIYLLVLRTTKLTFVKEILSPWANKELSHKKAWVLLSLEGLNHPWLEVTLCTTWSEGLL